MLIATHSIAAGIAGEKLGNPIIAFFAGIIIHFLLDAIPHFDTTDDGKLTLRQVAVVILDFILGIILIIYAMKVDLSFGNSFLWGTIGGVLPDVFDNLPIIQDSFRKTAFGKKVHIFHERIQSVKISPWLGIFDQYGLLLILVIYYLSQK